MKSQNFWDELFLLKVNILLVLKLFRIKLFCMKSLNLSKKLNSNYIINEFKTLASNDDLIKLKVRFQIFYFLSLNYNFNF